MTDAFMFYAWAVVSCCIVLLVWLKANAWAAVLAAIALLMVGVALNIIA